MRTVDIYVAGARSATRNLAAQHFAAHGFAVVWQSPWYGIARRGDFSFLGVVFSERTDIRKARVQFDFQIMEAPGDDELSVLRLERRLLAPDATAVLAVRLADEFELITDEIVADLQAHELVLEIMTYGAGAMVPPLSLPRPDPPIVRPVRPDLPPPPYPRGR